MTYQPDQCHIDHALAVAERSPCRSKRGVVLFNASTGASRGEGFNGPPALLPCPGRTVCAGTCGQRSVHAEMRALRSAAVYARHHDLDNIELVHVELAAPDLVRIEIDRSADGLPIGGAPHRLVGQVVACGGPSCWQCAREILDVGFVQGVWLYEEPVRRCLVCERFEDSSANIKDRWRRCCECGSALTPILAWRRYTAEEFYRVTLERCGIGIP